MGKWAKRNPKLASWFVEFNVRKELGGYFPENDPKENDYEKAYFFVQIFDGLKRMEYRRAMIEKTKRDARRGGH